jgi:hypothetical protein
LIPAWLASPLVGPLNELKWKKKRNNIRHIEHNNCNTSQPLNRTAAASSLHLTPVTPRHDLLILAKPVSVYPPPRVLTGTLVCRAPKEIVAPIVTNAVSAVYSIASSPVRTDPLAPGRLLPLAIERHVTSSIIPLVRPLLHRNHSSIATAPSW